MVGGGGGGGWLRAGRGCGGKYYPSPHLVSVQGRRGRSSQLGQISRVCSKGGRRGGAEDGRVPWAGGKGLTRGLKDALCPPLVFSMAED